MMRFSQRLKLGFTLVELLVVVGVISTITAMLAIALVGSQRQARATRCRNELLSYAQILQNRNAAISFSTPTRDEVSTASVGNPTLIGANALLDSVEPDDASRLNLLLRRDFARMLLPECRADLFYPPASIPYRERVGATTQFQALLAKVRAPSSWSQMREIAGLRTARVLDGAGGTAGLNRPVTNPAVDAIFAYQNNTGFRDLCAASVATGSITWTKEHESAECLYLILATTLSSRGQVALDQVPDRSIGDTDNDGVPEILDPWGQPVCFMRSPVGLQRSTLSVYSIDNGVEVFRNDPDPFDFLLSDFRFNTNFYDPATAANDALQNSPVYVAPIVVSAGPDGEFGLIRPEVLPGDYSSSIVQVTPVLQPQAEIGTFEYPQRYPDPFYPVRDFVGSTSAATAAIRRNGTSPFAGTARAKRGDGMGGFYHPDSIEVAIEVASDNLTSNDVN